MHDDGCGKHLRPGNLVFIDAGDSEFVKGMIWFIGVYLLDEYLRKGCKVGIMKALPFQMHLYGNRVASVSQVLRRNYDQTDQHSITVWDTSGRENFLLARQPARKEKDSKKSTQPPSKVEQTTLVDPQNSPTMEMVGDMRGMAVVTFADGDRKHPPVVHETLGYLIPSPSVYIGPSTFSNRGDTEYLDLGGGDEDSDELDSFFEEVGDEERSEVRGE